MTQEQKQLLTTLLFLWGQRLSCSQRVRRTVGLSPYRLELLFGEPRDEARAHRLEG